MKYLSLTIPGPGGDLTIDPVGGMPSGGIGVLEKIVQNAAVILFIFAIAFTFFMLVYSGWQWMTSGGDKQKLQQVRQRITYTIIGFILVFCAFLILNLISRFFGIGVFK